MSVRNNIVVEKWIAGQPAKNHRGSFWTNGKELYSYSLQIGDTVSSMKLLRDYTASGSFGFQSQTTSCHVGLAARHIDVVCA